MTKKILSLLLGAFIAVSASAERVETEPVSFQSTVDFEVSPTVSNGTATLATRDYVDTKETALQASISQNAISITNNSNLANINEMRIAGIYATVDAGDYGMYGGFYDQLLGPGTNLIDSSVSSNYTVTGGYVEWIETSQDIFDYSTSEILHYQLDDNAANTTVDDISTENNDGTASANTDTLNAPARIGSGSFQFDNAQGITTPASFITDATTCASGTVSFWVRAIDDTSNDHIMSFSASGGNPAMAVYRQTDDKLHFMFFDGSYQWRANSPATFTTNEWHHFILRHDGVTLTECFMDGTPYTPAFTITAAKQKWFDDGVSAGMNTFVVSGSYGGFFDGRLDDVRIWKNRVLTSNECNTLWVNYTNTSQTVLAITNRIEGSMQIVFTNDVLQPFVPDNGRVLAHIEDADGDSAINSEVTFEISSDAGSTWDNLLLSNEGTLPGGQIRYGGITNYTGASSNLAVRVTTDGSCDGKLHFLSNPVN